VGTLATTIHLLDGATVIDNISFTQTATTAGESRSICRGPWDIPLQGSAATALNVQATATAATTTIDIVVSAAKTGT
jgi:hypothetical protein